MNERPLAVALEYDGESAPKVTATGAGFIAERIIQIAQDHNIPLQKDTELVKALAQIPLGQEIPTELYLAVAQVIAFAYSLTGKTLPSDYDS